ncbi:hypothetical protein ACIQFZ_38520 [Streptomyces sp. NPDC093064]|uniref:hypothetical protein n=1 Tax=Streptomyces sp. NPDC093064 TaxID=3366020 RepID=UPI00380EFB2A
MDAKITGGELVEPAEPTPVLDLMAALQESVRVDATDFPEGSDTGAACLDDTYEALAAPRPCDTTALHRRLLLLSVRLWWHL